MKYFSSIESSFLQVLVIICCLPMKSSTFNQEGDDEAGVEGHVEDEDSVVDVDVDVDVDVEVSQM